MPGEGGTSICVARGLGVAGGEGKLLGGLSPRGVVGASLLDREGVTGTCGDIEGSCRGGVIGGAGLGSGLSVFGLGVQAKSLVICSRGSGSRTGKYLRKNLRLRMVTRPEPSTLRTY